MRVEIVTERSGFDLQAGSGMISMHRDNATGMANSRRSRYLHISHLVSNRGARKSTTANRSGVTMVFAVATSTSCLVSIPISPFQEPFSISEPQILSFIVQNSVLTEEINNLTLILYY